MKYEIKPYTYHQAEKIGVHVEPSHTHDYKIDVYHDGDYITSIGHKDYSDYPSYIESHGKQYADERRRLYHIRHKKDMEKVGSRGWLAGILLW